MAQAHGVDVMFTLSGAHVFPMYDGAVTAEPAMRILDVRHEQTAAFAAEAMGKLTRRPGLAVLTAGPGVTNGVSAIAQAQFSGSPLVVVGGRAPGQPVGQRLAPGARPAPDPGAGVQERPHHPHGGRGRRGDARGLHAGRHLAPRTGVRGRPDGRVLRHHRPRCDPRWGRDSASSRTATPSPTSPSCSARPSAPSWSSAPTCGPTAPRRPRSASSRRPGLPVITNGMGRGVVPGGHPLLVTKARGAALGGADLVVVAGTPLDFRLGYGVFGGKDGAAPARVVHLADSPGQVSQHADLAGEASGDLTLVLDGLRDAVAGLVRRPDWSSWVTTLQDTVRQAVARDAELLGATADPIHPARIYGELVPRLADDAVVIGDGGDFVSFAGKFVEPKRPGGWLDPGPYGCLGAGLGAAIAARLTRPSAQVVLLYGDGAAGMSLMDVDTLVRHHLPVVMVCGNNSAWGLEKGPMQMLYGYDVAADLGAADPLRRGRQGPRRRRRDRHRPSARSGLPSTAPSPRTSPTSST